jgi:hypothetical protein
LYFADVEENQTDVGTGELHKKLLCCIISTVIDILHITYVDKML